MAWWRVNESSKANTELALFGGWIHRVKLQTLRSERGCLEHLRPCGNPLSQSWPVPAHLVSPWAHPVKSMASEKQRQFHWSGVWGWTLHSTGNPTWPALQAVMGTKDRTGIRDDSLPFSAKAGETEAVPGECWKVHSLYFMLPLKWSSEGRNSCHLGLKSPPALYNSDPLHLSQAPPHTQPTPTTNNCSLVKLGNCVCQANFQKLLKWSGKMEAKEPQDYKIKIDFFFFIEAF